jgi:hypothetical protein
MEKAASRAGGLGDSGITSRTAICFLTSSCGLPSALTVHCSQELLHYSMWFNDLGHRDTLEVGFGLELWNWTETFLGNLGINIIVLSGSRMGRHKPYIIKTMKGSLGSPSLMLVLGIQILHHSPRPSPHPAKIQGC